MIGRRAIVGGGLALGLSGCDRIWKAESLEGLLGAGEDGNYALQRALQGQGLAREYAPNQRSPVFRANGTRSPKGDDYARHVATAFGGWTLLIDGMVARPQAVPLAALKRMPLKSQITRHDCVEGWSAIGKWTGVPLSHVLGLAGVSDAANYLVFHCADVMGNGAMYYESIDRRDMFHPQTILAFALNDALLPVQNGAPLRLRVERQLGYKHAKYVQRIEAVASLDRVYGGKGGYWEDAAGYEWYAGL